MLVYANMCRPTLLELGTIALNCISFLLACLKAMLHVSAFKLFANVCEFVVIYANLFDCLRIYVTLCLYNESVSFNY